MVGSGMRLAGRSLVDTFDGGRPVPANESLGSGRKLRSVAKSGRGDSALVLALLLGRDPVEVGVVPPRPLFQPLISAGLPQGARARHHRRGQRTVQSLSVGGGLRFWLQRGFAPDEIARQRYQSALARTHATARHE